MSETELFTLVRHAGYAEAGNPEFEQAVEVSGVTHTQSYLVRKAGGLLFGSLPEAVAAARADNRPERPGGPARAPGFFAGVRIGGADLYVPSGGAA